MSTQRFSLDAASDTTDSGRLFSTDDMNFSSFRSSAHVASLSESGVSRDTIQQA